MNTLAKYICFSLLLCSFEKLSGQKVAESFIRESFESQEEKGYREICYLHLAERIYLSGEPLAMGIHVVDGRFHLPTALSKVVYVELLGANELILAQQKILLENGAGAVVLHIPSDAPSGQYLLRAYTRWMRNEGESTFFQRWVKIVQPEAAPSLRPESGQEGPYQVLCQPIGGFWSSGRESTAVIEFRCADGRPMASRAVLVSQGDTLTSVKLDESGLGTLRHQFEEGKGYSLHFFAGEAQLHEESIPVVPSEGYAVEIDLPQVGSPIAWAIMAPKVRMSGQGEGGWLTVHHRGHLVHLERLSGQLGGKSSKLPSASWAGGIYHVSVWSEEGIWLAERYCWLPGAALSQAELGPQRQEIGFREEIRVELSPSGLSEADFPLQISLLCSQQPASTSGLRSFLEIQGDLPEPNALMCFTEEALSPAQLHAVLGLQRSHPPFRYTWGTSLGWTGLAAESEGLILSGKVLDGEGQGVAAQEVMLAVPGAAPFLHRSVSDEQGEFTMILEPAIGQPEVVILRGPEDMPADWRLSPSPSFHAFTVPKTWPVLWLSKEEHDEVARRFRSRQIDDRFVVENGLNGYPTTGYVGTYGEPSAVFRFADYTAMPTEETLREFILQASLRKVEGKEEIVLSNGQGQGFFSQPPLMLVDGVPVYDSKEVTSIPHRLVDRVEIINQPWLLQGRQYYGVFHLITRSANFSHSELRDNDLRLSLQLYRTAPKDPTYREATANLRLPDLSTLLKVTTMTWTRKESIELIIPASDEAGSYDLSVEGITARGFPVSKSCAIEVGKSGN